MAQGETTLLTAIVEHEEDRGNGIRMVRFTVGGDKHAAAIVNAVAGNWHEKTGRPELDIEAELDGRLGEKVTLVFFGGNMLGAPMLVAREGTLTIGSTTDKPILKPKGARNRGFVLNPDKIVDLIPGYAGQTAVELTEKAKQSFPVLRELTRERLRKLPRTHLGKSHECSLCVFGTWNTPEGLTTDAIWLIGEYEPEDDIVDGCVLIIRPEYGVSEHGSVYGQQLLDASVGEVVGFEPVSFADALALCEVEYEEAYKRLFPFPLSA